MEIIRISKVKGALFMNKKSKIYLVVLIWASVFFQLVINNSIDREKKMVEQVMSQGVENLIEGRAKAYAYYGDEELTIRAKEDMVKSLGRKLGVVSGFEITHEKINNGNVTTFSKLGQNGDTTIKVISLDVVDEYSQPAVENYIMVEVKLKGTAAKATSNYCDTLRDIYASLGMEPTTNIYLCSQEKGQLVASQMEQYEKDFFNSMDARRIDGVEFDDVHMVFGYSKNLEEYVYQNEEKVNVNIAFSYDSVEDVTYIHMGVPFVDRSF